MRSRTIAALLPDFAVRLALVVFAVFFGVVAFFVLAAFLLAFPFFGIPASALVVVSCVLIIVLLCVECIGRHIHHSGCRLMRGARLIKEIHSERTGSARGKRGSATRGRQRTL